MGFFQCSVPCHHKTYDNETAIRRMLEEQADMKIPADLIPHCPVCGKVMTMNLRTDHTFVQDEGWYRASGRYTDFIRSLRTAIKDRPILFLELGVGMNTPGIIRQQISFFHPPYGMPPAKNLFKGCTDILNGCLLHDKIEQKTVSGCKKSFAGRLPNGDSPKFLSGQIDKKKEQWDSLRLLRVFAGVVNPICSITFSIIIYWRAVLLLTISYVLPSIQRTDLYRIGESLIGMEKEKRGADPEKFMAYIRTKVVDDGMYYLLLDEIQMLDCFEAVLNSYLRKDNMDVFVTGSNAKFLSKDIATEFAGRGDEIHMYPLSFAEFMSVYEGDKYTGLSEYMLYGGIPLVVLRDGVNDKAAALQNLFREIYIQDIVRRNRVKNIGELEDLLNILSSAIGSLTNPEKLKNTFRTMKQSKITSNTIKKYLDYFEDSFLIESAQRYDIKRKAYIETPKKILLF